jgi:hypothetical protein
VIDFVLFAMLFDQRVLIEKSFLKERKYFQILILILKEKNNFSNCLV